MADRRKPTSTSNFGVSKRESHDASDFYAWFSAPVLDNSVDIEPHKEIDDIFVGNSAAMTQVADNSVALVVTSPPYFAGKAYEEALGSGDIPANYIDYLGMLREVFVERLRTLEPGGRMAINVANLGRKPFRSLASDVISILQDDLKMLLRGEVIWLKARGSARSCARGSFQRPANPVLRDLSERVIIANKGRFDRAVNARAAKGLPCDAVHVPLYEFMEVTTDIWEIPPESVNRVGYPAPFPVDLPEAPHPLTYYDDLVLDPFMGVGHRLRRAAHRPALRRARHRRGLRREGPGACRAQRHRLAGPPIPTVCPSFVLPPVPLAAPDDEDFQARGQRPRTSRRALLEECGFTPRSRPR